MARVTSGPNAINEKKKLEEGLPEFAKMIWGLWYDSRDSDGEHWGLGTVTLPELKIRKCKDIFEHPSFANGTRRILIHTVQVARGNGEWAAQVQPLLRVEMRVLDILLGGAPPGSDYAQPPLSSDALEEFWMEFDEAMEFLRLLFGCEEMWKGQWTNTMEGLLDISERLTLPGTRPTPARVWSFGAVETPPC